MKRERGGEEGKTQTFRLRVAGTTRLVASFIVTASSRSETPFRCSLQNGARNFSSLYNRLWLMFNSRLHLVASPKQLTLFLSPISYPLPLRPFRLNYFQPIRTRCRFATDTFPILIRASPNYFTGRVNHSVVTKWLKNIFPGCKNRDNKTRSSRPKTIDSEAVLQALAVNTSSGTQRV